MNSSPTADVTCKSHTSCLVLLSVNEDLRLRERSRVFDIPGLFEIIAKARSCMTEEIVGFRGGINRTFLITLADDFKLVARIPYLILIPKAYAYASEVATMDFLRSKGVPIPEVYAYSFTSENEAGTEYILMEYVEGTDLSQIWFTSKDNRLAYGPAREGRIYNYVCLFFCWREHLLRRRPEAAVCEQGHSAGGGERGHLTRRAGQIYLVPEGPVLYRP
jgi:hypothetical protein